MPQEYTLIIIGGGPIGIACALEAKKRNISYLVIEKGLSEKMMIPGDTLLTRVDSSILDDVKAQLTLVGFGPAIDLSRRGVETLREELELLDHGF